MDLPAVWLLAQSLRFESVRFVHCLIVMPFVSVTFSFNRFRPFYRNTFYRCLYHSAIMPIGLFQSTTRNAGGPILNSQPEA
jgi:hypothetical protein